MDRPRMRVMVDLHTRREPQPLRTIRRHLGIQRFVMGEVGFRLANLSGAKANMIACGVSDQHEEDR